LALNKEDIMRQLIIDPELRDWLGGVPKMTDEQLEQSLLEFGRARDKIVVWKGKDVVVDGHRRYAVCQRLGLPYEIEEVEFADKEAVKAFMDRWQKARRNLSAHEDAQITARIFERERVKEPVGAARRAAEEAGVSERQVYRAKEYIDLLEKLPDDIKAVIDSGEVVATIRDLKDLTSYGEVHQRSILRQLQSGEFKTLGEVLRGDDDDDGDDMPFAGSASRSESAPDAAPEPAPKPKPKRTLPPAKPAADVISGVQKKIGHLAREIDLCKPFDPARHGKAQKLLEPLDTFMEAWRKEVA
jgi:hypothetical protein